MKTLISIALWVLFCLIAATVFAKPVTFDDPKNQTGGQPQSDPTLVRLDDGTIVPFGPGVRCTIICSDADFNTSSLENGFDWKRPLVVSLAAVGAVAVVQWVKSQSSANVVTSGGITINEIGRTIAANEPSCLILLGSGLAYLASKCKKKKK